MLVLRKLVGEYFALRSSDIGWDNGIIKIYKLKMLSTKWKSFFVFTLDKSPCNKEEWTEIIAKSSDMLPLLEGAISVWLKNFYKSAVFCTK